MFQEGPRANLQTNMPSKEDPDVANGWPKKNLV